MKGLLLTIFLYFNAIIAMNDDAFENDTSLSWEFMKSVTDINWSVINYLSSLRSTKDSHTKNCLLYIESLLNKSYVVYKSLSVSEKEEVYPWLQALERTKKMLGPQFTARF